MKTTDKIIKIYNRLSADKRGFTLIELIIVFTIMTFLSLSFISNFRPSAQNMTVQKQAASVIISDIRAAESMTLSGTRYKGNLVCGYGVHYVDSNTYLIYAKGVPIASPCSAVITRNYDPGTDFTVNTKKVFGTNTLMDGSFKDVFFEPPDPKIYINNDSALTVAPTSITIKLRNQVVCLAGQCVSVVIYSSGQLDLQ